MKLTSRPLRRLALASLALTVVACEGVEAPTEVSAPAAAARDQSTVRLNVLLGRAPTPAILAELGAYGTVVQTIDEIRAVTLQGSAGSVSALRALPYVRAAGRDAARAGAPVDAVPVADFAAGRSTWDLDAINVTNAGAAGRTVPYDGSGVYVGVLDTGLLDSWRQYFPEERIAEEYARAFSGGPLGATPETPNQWEHDQDSHGTHVTSTILGYSLNGTAINGVAPGATVIPVKVLGNDGNGWSSVIARGIVYLADLAAGPLAGSRVVVNMSLGGPVLDPVEQAAIDYALARGVIVVASAGNTGPSGNLSYPAAYAPVISVAASGWVGEWMGGGSWWNAVDVPDPTDPAQHYIADFSSRAAPGQDLDVAAPGTWVVGPYQTQSGKTSYFFLGGTSMAAPHVTGIVALLAQKDPSLTAAGAEATLVGTAIPLPPGCRMVTPEPGVPPAEICWGADAAGAGLATADAALGGTAMATTGTPPKKKR